MSANLEQSDKAEIVSPRRWVVLGIAWLSFFSIAMAWYVMPTLEHKLLEIYQIDSSQYSTAFTIPFLIAGLLAIGGGMLADRLGLRKTASLGIIISGLGILGRFQANGFISLLAPMMIVGVGLGLIMPNLPKLVSIWFPPEETGLATGIYNTGLMGGIATGLVIAPYLPGWSSGNILFGILIIVLGIVFFAIVRDTPPGKELPPTSLVDGLKSAIQSKSIWAAAFAVFMAMAGMVSVQAAYPGGLNKMYGIPMSTGGGIASMLTYPGILGSLTLPTWANKLDKRKLFLFILPIAFAVIMTLTWFSGDNITVLWIGTALAGYLAGGALPLIMEVPVFLTRMEDDPVEPQHVGGASGLLTSLMNIGGFIGLPFIVMPIITSFGYTKGFIVAVLIFAAQAIFALNITFPSKVS
ncbi:MFS transporter [Selenihalanaerobacter shriftii]|uniref:Major Facilitator Superfamily protein n=1 Tax=Selenihalanaerobacter shriftii TaxID=142842 RepID=A0A1T4MVG3_9FIRM|nr:MFS transporter [Selenihalanaerobacter shriftii]SJZ70638.1 Major Facilitator Superfamily protein [Selenihalanaerobacter shriftii]